MWAAVYMAEGERLAKQIEEYLKGEGFLVKIRHFSKMGDNLLYEVLVPEFEAEEAQEALLDLNY